MVYNRAKEKCCGGSKVYSEMKGWHNKGKCCKKGKVYDGKRYFLVNGYASDNDCVLDLVAQQIGWAGGAATLDALFKFAGKGGGPGLSAGAMFAIVASAAQTCSSVICPVPSN